MKPSSDIENPVPTFPIFVFPFHAHGTAKLPKYPTARTTPTSPSMPRSTRRLVRKLLQGPAVAVWIAEGGVKDSSEILDLPNLHSSFE